MIDVHLMRLDQTVLAELSFESERDQKETNRHVLVDQGACCRRGKDDYQVKESKLTYSNFSLIPTIFISLCHMNYLILFESQMTCFRTFERCNCNCNFFRIADFLHIITWKCSCTFTNLSCPPLTLMF